MDNEQLNTRLQDIRDRLPDESKAAAMMDALLSDISAKATTQGGGNGNGPPTGP